MEPAGQHQASLEDALATFERRAQQLRLGSAKKDFDRCTEIAGLLSQIKALTLLESKAVNPCKDQRKEEDEERQELASRHNTRGMAHFKSKRWAQALEAFTDAACTWPHDHAYHSNMAAAALKLGVYAAAQQAAHRAIHLAPDRRKARQRLALAWEGHRQWDSARDEWRRVAALGPSDEATAGIARCQAQLQQGRASAAGLQGTGLRPPLPPHHMPLAQAAQHLEAARDMVTANPCLEAAHISLVESLLLCGLLGEALEAAQQLQDGPERQYLMAQAALRSGDAHGAARLLQEYISSSSSTEPQPQGNDSKLLQLAATAGHLVQLAGDYHKWIAAGEYAPAVEVGQKALDLCSRKAGYPGLVSHWCCLLAEAHLAMEEKGSAAEALKVLGQVDSLCGLAPGEDDPLPQVHWWSAQAHTALSHFEAAFLELHALQQLQPEWPGLGAALAAAAQQCLQHQATQAGGSASGNTWGPSDNTGGGTYSMRQHDAVVECCQVLGLQPRDALSREVIEKAYRKQAAKVHPDAHQARVRSTAHCQGTSDSTHAQVVDSDNHKSCSSPTETGSLSTGAAELQQQGVVQQGGSKVAAGQAGTSASKVKEAAEHQFIRVHEARQMLLDLLKL